MPPKLARYHHRRSVSVVLTGGYRQRACHRPRDNIIRLLLLEEVFDNDAASRVAKAVAGEYVPDGFLYFSKRHRYDDPFSGRQPIPP